MFRPATDRPSDATVSGVHVADALVLARRGPLHEQPAHAKMLALLAFVIVVVSTPGLPPEAFGATESVDAARHIGLAADTRTAWAAAWPFAGYAVLLAAVAALARIPPGTLARRTAVEAPFVVFALLMPFVATGPRVAFGPFSLSVEGLAGGLTLLVKATLGVVAAVLLASTTGSRELLTGLERLRLPAAFVAILSFMIRYVAVVAQDAARMRIARVSRGAREGRTRALAAMAAGAGSLFVRSYERGERVHRAMLSRGYDGRMPPLAPTVAGRGLSCALLPLAAACVLTVSTVSRL